MKDKNFSGTILYFELICIFVQVFGTIMEVTKAFKTFTAV